MKKILLSVLTIFIMTSFAGCKDDKKSESKKNDISVSVEGTTEFKSYDESETDSEQKQVSTEKNKNDDLLNDSENNTEGILTTASESVKTKNSATISEKDNAELPVLNNENTVTTENKQNNSNTAVETTVTTEKEVTTTTYQDNDTQVIPNSDGAIELPFIPIEDLQ